MGYIGLSDKRDNSDVSGYFNAETRCLETGVSFLEVSTYNLSGDEDKRLLSSLDIDVLIVSGWQRLIPEYLIQHCKVCAVGLHGSPLGITQGRGRSPQNWALMMGMQSFEACIFKIDKEIDGGEIIASAAFEYSPRDNIRTSYLKTSYLMAKMTVDAIKSGAIFQKGVIQDERSARYLPKRDPEHGMIDWNRNGVEIVNFIRALTKPYPGAFTIFRGQEIRVWDAVEFTGIGEIGAHQNGELIHRYVEGELLVKCSDGAVIIKNYESDLGFDSTSAVKFDSADFQNQLQDIIQKHYKKYPDLTVSKELVA